VFQPAGLPAEGGLAGGYPVFDEPQGIQNLKYAANHNILTHKA
jgi:hypothetical protein